MKQLRRIGMLLCLAAALALLLLPLQPVRAEASASLPERKTPAWAKTAIVYEVNVRQYTPEGTFRAFEKHLGELRDMGVNTLWFMPIHPISEVRRIGPLGSYYSIADYRAVNPEFGSAEDFRALVESAHAMGFHVMMDWVANHTGWDNVWIQDHPHWYTWNEYDEIISPVGMGWDDVADLNYDEPEMRAEMIDCMKYWVTEFDVDGFRCDFANGVPTDFWEQARAELEREKPLLMLAEHSKLSSLLNYAFDMNYNWELYDALLAVARGVKKANVLQYYVPENYPEGTYTLNFLDNHDKNSYEHTVADAFKPELLPAMFTMIHLLPGTPLIYTGDEIGYDHAIAFFERDPVRWDNGTGDFRPLLRALSDLRTTIPALWSGSAGAKPEYFTQQSKNIFAMRRASSDGGVVLLTNLFKREQTADVSAFLQGGEKVLLHGGPDLLEKSDAFPEGSPLRGEVTLQPWEFWILSVPAPAP